jgi:regulator of protease activity HflC (stomatin/prohibitin superfamily)
MIIGVIGFVLFVLLTVGLWWYAIAAGIEAPGRGMAGALGVVTSILAFLSLGFVQIQPGHVGVVTSFGQVNAEEMRPGLHWRLPVIFQVNEVDTRIRAVRVEGYTAASQEQQDLFLNITLNYHVIPESASDIVQNIGTDFEAKIVMPRFLDIPKSITDDYRTTVVLNSRDEIRERAEDELSQALEPYGLIVDTINIENFSYSPEYNAEIEAKQRAEQRVETARQEQREAEVQAETARIAAEGQANARIEQARGEAEANRLLAESISDQLISWQAIQKLNPNVEIMLLPADDNFILDLQQLRPEEIVTP